MAEARTEGAARGERSSLQLSRVATEEDASQGGKACLKLACFLENCQLTSSSSSLQGIVQTSLASALASFVGPSKSLTVAMLFGFKWFKGSSGLRV